MKKIVKQVIKFQKVCPYCELSIESEHKEQVKYNYNTHVDVCKSHRIRLYCDVCKSKKVHSIHGFEGANRRYKCLACHLVSEDGGNE